MYSMEYVLISVLFYIQVAARFQGMHQFYGKVRLMKEFPVIFLSLNSSHKQYFWLCVNFVRKILLFLWEKGKFRADSHV